MVIELKNETQHNMADSASTSSDVDVEVEESVADSSDEPEEEEEEGTGDEPTENYVMAEGEGTEYGELQPLQLEVEEEEGEGVGEEEVAEEQEPKGEIDLQELGDVLKVEAEVLSLLQQQFPHVLSNVKQVLDEKTGLVAQYEFTVSQFSENLSNADQTLRKSIASINYIFMLVCSN